MSELSEAEWNCRIAEAMGYEESTNCLGEKRVSNGGSGCFEFNILTNPADCLAAIKHFRRS